MKTENNIDTEVSLAKPARDIPNPPSGGSWRFDHVLWGWVDLNPQPEAADKPNQE